MRALDRHRRVLVQCPTGGGKTVIATAVAQELGDLDLRVWFICHRAELVHQTSMTFTKAGIEHSFIASGRNFNAESRVHICSIDTLKSWMARGKTSVRPDIVIWDECHHVGAAGWTKVMKELGDAYHVGLSATPVRLDGTGLDSHFDEIVLGPSVSWLIEQGFLSQYRVFAPSAPNMKGVKSRGGDWATGDAEQRMTPKLTGDAIEHWLRHAAGLRTVVFAVSVAHSKSVVEAFNAAGIPSAHLDGDTPKEERAETIRKFADGELLVLSNVSLFGEGFDLAAIAGRDVTIDCVVLLRPTQSLSLFLQMVGRCLRPFLDKVGIIIDHAGNTLLHGFPDDEREWPLAGRAKRASDGETGPPPPATCSGCFMQVRRPCPEACPYCGAPLVLPRELPKSTKGQLAELKRAEVEARKRAREEAKTKRDAEKLAAKEKSEREQREVRACRTLEDLEKLGQARGYHPGWADKRWSSRSGRRAGFQR